jgi:Cu/Zn superoxide dismutase
MTPRFVLPRLVPILLLLTGAGAVTGCDNSGSNGPETMTYTADLGALNSSGVTGQATITVEGDQLTVSVEAEGTVAEQVHAQHIHGATDGAASSCPTMSADSDGNGRISVGEGAPAYGGILVPLDGSLDAAEGLGDLDTFPVADANGAYTYDQSVATDELALNEDRSFEDLRLANHAVVVHGAVVDGEYAATLPVACGTLSRTA